LVKAWELRHISRAAHRRGGVGGVLSAGKIDSSRRQQKCNAWNDKRLQKPADDKCDFHLKPIMGMWPKTSNMKFATIPAALQLRRRQSSLGWNSAIHALTRRAN
jgi:hypothetical protein